MKKIQIVCDGNTEIGLGHIRRSLSLAECFSKLGQAVFVTSQTAESNSLISGRFSTSLVPEILVLDLPYGVEDWVEQCRRDSIPCVALDYFGAANPDITISLLELFSPPPLGRRLSGYDYAIIRPDVLEHKNIQPELRNCLVIMGGADVNNETITVAKQLLTLDEEVKVILGPFSKMNQWIDPRFTVYKNPHNLAWHMAESRWGVTNAGGSMLEMMYLGKAVHVIPQTDYERRIGEQLVKKRAILGLGSMNLKEYSDNELNQVSKNASQLIDGYGVTRICKQIMSLVPERDV